MHVLTQVFDIQVHAYALHCNHQLAADSEVFLHDVSISTKSYIEKIRQAMVVNFGVGEGVGLTFRVC